MHRHILAKVRFFLGFACNLLQYIKQTVYDHSKRFHDHESIMIELQGMLLKGKNVNCVENKYSILPLNNRCFPDQRHRNREVNGHLQVLQWSRCNSALVERHRGSWGS